MSGADPCPPCSHQPTRDTSPQAQRTSGAPQEAGTQGKDQEKWPAPPGPSLGAQHPAVTPLRMTQGWATTRRDLRVLLLWVWGTPGDAGEGAFGDCTMPIMGCLGEEPQAGKGLDVGDLGRSKSGKTGVRGWKGLGTCKQAAGGDVLVWPCPMPAQHRLSCFLLHSFQIFSCLASILHLFFQKNDKVLSLNEEGKADVIFAQHQSL